MNLQTYPMPDELMERYYILVNTQDIGNIARYALEWKLLAEDAEKAGRIACAEAWGKRWRYFADQAGEEYLQLIDGSFLEPTQIADKSDDKHGL